MLGYTCILTVMHLSGYCVRLPFLLRSCAESHSSLP